MDNKNDDFSKPRVRRTNIDGFIVRPTKVRNDLVGSLKATQPNQIPLRPLNTPPRLNSEFITSRPKPNSNPQSQSLIGISLPNSFAGNKNNQSSNFSNPPTSKKPKKHRSRLRKVTFRTFIIILVVLLGVGGFVGYKGLKTINKVFHGNIFSDIAAPFSSTPLKGENSGRINILLAGDSVDDPNHQGASLTDSIMVLSLNTKTDQVFLLSIPRDLWVYVPGLSSYQKINAANTVLRFNQSGYPAGGMGELEQIITTQLGIPIDYYGLIDYTAFRDAVNAVGGVTINIQSSNPYGLYDPYTNLKLPNGWVTLNGQQALNLARSRGDGPGAYGFPESDFDRTAHQRQLFTAVAQKALTLGFLSNPAKISNLFNAFGNNLQTDLSLQNVIRLIQYVKNINLNNIQSYAFAYGSTNNHPKSLLTGYIDPSSGQDALVSTDGVGVYTSLTNYYKQLTSNNPLVVESAPITILNGSSQVGLAQKEEAILKNQGYNVIGVADASKTYANSVIVDQSGGQEPLTLAVLKKEFSSQAQITNTTNYGQESYEAVNYESSFVMILGNNFKIN